MIKQLSCLHHTYFVGDCAVWVHNAECTPKEYIDSVESGETELKTTKQKGNYGKMKMEQYSRPT